MKNQLRLVTNQEKYKANIPLSLQRLNYFGADMTDPVAKEK